MSVCEELVWEHEMRRVFLGEKIMCVEVQWDREAQLQETIIFTSVLEAESIGYEI